MKSNSNDTKIELTQNKYCVVDPIDYDLSNVKWCAIKQGKTLVRYRAVRKGVVDSYYKTIIMHRVIMERVLGRPLLHNEQIDHVNHDTLDNRRSNLRLVSNAQNQMNRRKGPNCSSRYKGVTWDISKGMWMAQIMHNQKHSFLGRYSTEEEAAEAYDQKAKQLFGDFAHLNFPEDHSP